MSTEIVYLDTPEKFQDVRRGKLGSSDIAAICGLNPWRTPLQVYFELCGLVPPQEENRAMRLGKAMEPVVAQEFAIEHPSCIVEDPKSSWIRDWSIATPDRLVCTPETKDMVTRFDSILECKTTGAHMKKSWESGIPDLYQCQVHWQMGLTGRRHAYIAALIGGREYIDYELQFDEAVFSQLWELGEKFMERVKTLTPPDPVGADLDTIKQVFNEPVIESIELNSEAEEMARKLLEARARVGEAENEKEKIESWMRLALGNAAKGIGQRYNVTLKTVKKDSYVVKKQEYTQLKVEEVK